MFVAGFMGSPSMNFIPAELAARGRRAAVTLPAGDGGAAALPLPRRSAARARQGGM